MVRTANRRSISACCSSQLACPARTHFLCLLFVLPLWSQSMEFRVTQRSEPIFNVPAAVIAVIVVCVFVHLARVYVLTDVQDDQFLRQFAFIPTRYDHALALQLDIPDGWATDVWSFFTYAFIHGDATHLAVNTI